MLVIWVTLNRCAKENNLQNIWFAYQKVLPKTFLRHAPGLAFSCPVCSKRRASSRSFTTVSRRVIDFSTYKIIQNGYRVIHVHLMNWTSIEQTQIHFRTKSCSFWLSFQVILEESIMKPRIQLDRLCKYFLSEPEKYSLESKVVLLLKAPWKYVPACYLSNVWGQ